MSTYDWLVAEYTGLSKWRGRREDGGSIPGGMEWRIISSRLTSIHSWASSKLDLVVTRRTLLRPADSIHRNQGFHRRCLCREMGALSDGWCGSITANQADTLNWLEWLQCSSGRSYFPLRPICRSADQEASRLLWEGRFRHRCCCWFLMPAAWRIC